MYTASHDFPARGSMNTAGRGKRHIIVTSCGRAPVLGRSLSSQLVPVPPVVGPRDWSCLSLLRCSQEGLLLFVVCCVCVVVCIVAVSVVVVFIVYEVCMNEITGSNVVR